MGAFTFSPMLAMSYFGETQHAYADGLGNVVPAQKIGLGSLDFGPRFSYLIKGEGLDIKPSIGLMGSWDYSVDGTGATSTEVSARIKSDIDLRLNLWRPRHRGPQLRRQRSAERAAERDAACAGVIECRRWSNDGRHNQTAGTRFWRPRSEAARDPAWGRFSVLPSCTSSPGSRRETHKSLARPPHVAEDDYLAVAVIHVTL